MKLSVGQIKIFFLGKYSTLLICLIFLLLLQPFAHDTLGIYIIEILFTVVLFAGLWAIQQRKKLRIFNIVLVLLSLTFTYLGMLAQNQILFLLGMIFRVLFMISVAITILYSIFNCKRVTADVLSGAISVYLYISLIWACIFILIEFVVPGSFSFTQGDKRMDLWISKEFNPFLYFSMVTITTVGYGDVSPVSEAARSFATMEAFIGQIYLTVLVAGLVGMYLAQRKIKEPD